MTRKKEVITNRQKIAARKYVLEGKTKVDSLTEAGYGRAYIRSNMAKLFGSKAIIDYMDELTRKKEEEVTQLWRIMANDAPEIYRKYKDLAEKTDSDDVRRRIYANILDRTGYIGANKLEVTNRKIDPESIDKDLAKVLQDLKEENIDITQFTETNDE